MGGGEHSSERNTKHLCGAGGDKVQLDGLQSSGLSPSSASSVGTGEREAWSALRGLVPIEQHGPH